MFKYWKGNRMKRKTTRRKLKRGPQIIMPKDCGIILSYTMFEPGSRIVDAGAGSGFLATFLGKYNKPGKVYTYEKNEKFLDIIKDNIKKSGLEKFVKLKNVDVTKGIKEKRLDLVTLDLKDAYKAIPHAYTSLKINGKIVVYSPTVEHLIKSLKSLRKAGFKDIETVENILREWKSEYTTRPKTMGIMHTGFLTFAKK